MQINPGESSARVLLGFLTGDSSTDVTDGTTRLAPTRALLFELPRAMLGGDTESPCDTDLTALFGVATGTQHGPVGPEAQTTSLR